MTHGNKIVKNSIILYGRTIITFGLSLFSTRVILKTLGVEDFGIYGLVLSALAVLSFLNNTLSSATQRFLSVGQGRADQSRQAMVFQSSMVLHFLIGLLVLVMIEGMVLIGVDRILSVSSERLFATTLIVHIMGVRTFLNILGVPYEALLSAHEDMLFFSILGVLEVVLTFIVALLMPHFDGDRLIFYSVAILIIGVLLFFARLVYTQRKYVEARLTWPLRVNKADLLEISHFAGWSFFSTISMMARAHGVTFILNQFFGTAANAAQGIAQQINGQLNVLSASLVRAFSPQVNQREGKGARESMIDLTMSGAKFSFFLLALPGIPFILEAPYILKLWLVNPPQYSVVFCRLLYFCLLFGQISNPLTTAIYAAGNIRKFSIYTSIIDVLYIPITIMVLTFGAGAHYVYIVQIGFEIVFIIFRLWMASQLLSLNVYSFIRVVLRPSFLLFGISIAGGALIGMALPEGLIRLLCVLFVSPILFCFSGYFFGLTNQERDSIKGLLDKIPFTGIFRKHGAGA